MSRTHSSASPLRLADGLCRAAAAPARLASMPRLHASLTCLACTPRLHASPTASRRASLRLACRYLDERDVTVVDTTCPWVSKVWTTVDRHQRSEMTSLIHGKYQHEEAVATGS